MPKTFSDQELLGIFKQAQRDLIAAIERSGSGPFSAFRREQLWAIDALIARLSKQVQRWTEKKIPTLITEGSEDILKQIEGFGEGKFKFQFAGVSQNAIKFLTERAALEYGSTIIGLRKNASKAMLDKRLLQEKLISGVTQGSSVARTQGELVDMFKKDGIEVFKGKNGVSFKVEPYANMLIRSQSMAAYNSGARLQLLGAGRRFAKIPKITPDIDGPDICNDYEKRKYIDLTKDQLPPWHPHCRHTVQAVSFEELKAERPDLYEIAIRYFRAAAE